MLTVENLTIRTPEKTLVENMNLSVKTGESWFVYGANGAGKSTLLRVMAGLTSQIQQGIFINGAIKINGQPAQSIPPVQLAYQRAWLPQSQSDAFGWTVFETVLASRYPHHGGLWEKDADIDVAEQALQRMDLMPLADRDIRQLSGGERQRTAIASLIAQEAPLMLMDEPATALDLPHQQMLLQFIREQIEREKAVVTIVHDINLARFAATHVLLLNGDGSWEAGKRKAVMTAEKLSHCLHSQIRAIPYDHDEVVFVPA